jgi:hypothetical protein
LEDQNGVPFRVHGDAAWSLIANLTVAEVDTYLDARRSQGFNAVIVNLIEHKFAQKAPANVSGVYPFGKDLSGAGYTSGNQYADFSTMNEAWFVYADQVLQAITSRGLLAIVNPAYVGYGGPTTASVANEGWSADMNANVSGQCTKYGQYVGNRYRGYRNVLWLNVTDAIPGVGSPMETCVKQVMAGVKVGSGNGGSSGLHSIELLRTHNSTDDLTASATGSWDYNSVYVRSMWKGGTPFTQGRSAYDYAPAIPALVIEDLYAGTYSGAPTTAQARDEAWGDVLSTIGGYVFGQDLVWSFGNGNGPGPRVAWNAELATNEAADMQRLGTFMSSIAWQTLVPSTSLVTAGGGGEGTADYVNAAVASDGSLGVVYIPAAHSGSVTIDLSKMRGMVTARWYDPTAGTLATLGTFASSGTHAFSTPGKNGAGAADWVLELTGD